MDASLADEIGAELAKELEVAEPTPLSRSCLPGQRRRLGAGNGLGWTREAIVTGDKDLLVLKEFQGIKILSPRQFVEWMDRQK